MMASQRMTIPLPTNKRKTKAPIPKESEIRAQIKQYLQWQGWFVFYQLQGLGSYLGLPDLQAVKDGCTIYIEVKRPGGRQSAKQKKSYRSWKLPGVLIFWQGK